MEENMVVVVELILSQKNQLGTYCSKREIADLTDIPKSPLDRIANMHMDLQGFHKIKG